jgi:hypothetical protein
MSQGPYPPGREPADGSGPHPPHADYPQSPAGRTPPWAPQPEWPPRPDAGPPADQHPPQYRGNPEPPYGPAEPAGFGSQPSGFGPPPSARGPEPAQPPESAWGPEPTRGPEPGRAPEPGRGPASGGTYGSPTQPIYQPPERYADPNPGQFGDPRTSQFGGAPGAGGFDEQRTSQFGSPFPEPGAGSFGEQRTGQFGGDPYPPEPPSSRFSSLRYDEPETPATPPKSRRGLIIGVAIASVAVLVLAALGVTWAMSGGSNDFAVDSCVKKSGKNAVETACSGPDVYKIVSRVDSETKCPDQSQPHVTLLENGKPDQVLCLKKVQ